MLVKFFSARGGAEARSDLRRMMTESYLTTLLEEAEYVVEQHDQVARTTDNQAHEYLRYAVLRVLEGESEHLPADWTPIAGVTVGYGSDDAMYDSWGSSEDWWETVPPQERCTRFRVFFPDDYQRVPRDIVDVMAALGAWRVWTGCAAACGSYDHRERDSPSGQVRGRRRDHRRPRWWKQFEPPGVQHRVRRGGDLHREHAHRDCHRPY